jgi:hypothetical protein
MQEAAENQFLHWLAGLHIIVLKAELIFWLIIYCNILTYK